MCNLSWTPPPTLRDHTSSWTTLEISFKTFVCYPVNMMCSKSNHITSHQFDVVPTLFKHIGSMLVQCHANIGPASCTLAQCWSNVVYIVLAHMLVQCHTTNIGPASCTLAQFWRNVVYIVLAHMLVQCHTT